VPIIAMLGAEYEAAQIIVTGVLGPGSNAHGPNESIDMPYTLKFTQAMSELLAKCSIYYSSAATK
jgi:di/tripeptidase